MDTSRRKLVCGSFFLVAVKSSGQMRFIGRKKKKPRKIVAKFVLIGAYWLGASSL